MIDRLWIMDKTKWKKPIYLKSAIKDIYNLCRSLRLEQFELAIDLSGLLRSGVICMLSKAKAKIGFEESDEGSPFFYTDKVKGDMGIHAIDRYLKIAEFIGCNIDELKFPFAPFPENPPSFHSLPEKYIIMAPSAGKEANRWPPDRFGKLAAKLPFPSVVICSSSEFYIGKEVEKNAKGNVISLAGRTHLKELIAIIKKGSFFISNDTGPMHIAAALNIPVFAIFGPANPTRTGPYGSIHTIIKRDLSCSPCYRKTPCSDWKCMNEITVDMVYETISKKIL
jgi:ADP-heptose:LPS heptosyltransferase